MRNLYNFFKWMRKGTMFLIIISALTMPTFADSTHGEYLTYKGYLLNTNGSINALIYQYPNGNVEVFEWYDTTDSVSRYVGSILYYEAESDMIAVYEKVGKYEYRCCWSDWD